MSGAGRKFQNTAHDGLIWLIHEFINPWLQAIYMIQPQSKSWGWTMLFKLLGIQTPKKTYSNDWKNLLHRCFIYHHILSVRRARSRKRPELVWTLWKTKVSRKFGSAPSVARISSKSLYYFRSPIFSGHFGVPGTYKYKYIYIYVHVSVFIPI